MSYVAQSHVTQGDATKASVINQAIDNDAYLYATLSAGGGGGSGGGLILNGSFETVSGGIPSNWTQTLFSGGSGASDTTTPISGAKAYKFTSPGGSGNGGGYLVSSFFECTPNRDIAFSWQMKGTATVTNIVTVLWYDATQSSLSSSVIYTAATGNPTSWEQMKASVTPPSGARYAKLQITGCDSSNTTAGNTYFDDVQAWEAIPSGVAFLTSASGNWTCPNGVYRVNVRIWGGGGGGTLHSGFTGGGGGGYTESIVQVTPGVSYAYTVGAGGSGTADGASSTIFSQTSGGGNGSANGSPGVGGTGTIAGETASSGNYSGSSPFGGCRATNGAGAFPGGGGYGNSGANGLIKIEWGF